MTQYEIGELDLTAQAAAAQTATNYITADTSGIKIHAANNVGTNYQYLTSNGTEIYKGGNSVAAFGDTARIGTSSGSHATVDTTGLHIWNGTESIPANEIASFGDTARIGTTDSSSFYMNANSLEGYDSNHNKYFEVNANGITFGTYNTEDILNSNIQIGGKNYAVNCITDTATTNGITEIISGPATITVNGTASAATNISQKRFCGLTLKPGIYVIWFTDTHNGDIYLRIGQGSNSSHVYSSAGIYNHDTPYVLSVTTEDIYYVSPIYKQGATFSNFTTRIMIEKGNIATDWRPAEEDVEASINTAISNVAQNWFATCSTAAAAKDKEAIITPAITDFILKAGTTVNVKFTNTNTFSASATNGWVTLNVNNTGAKNIYYSNTNNPTGANTTAFGRANYTNTYVYDGTYWVWVSSSADNNSTYTMSDVLWNQAVKASTDTYVGTHIIVGDSTGYRNLAANKTFDLSYPILYYATAATTTIASGKTANNHYLDRAGVTFTTNGTIVSGAAYQTLYLKGTVSGNTFTIAESPFMTTIQPSNADGYIYVPLGVMSSATAGRFVSSKDLYAYIDGKFRQVTPTEIVASHRIYYRTTTANNNLAAPAIWIDEATTNVYNIWTTKVPPLANGTDSSVTGYTRYPYLYTCEQRKRLDGTVECTKVLLDENTTIIDGGSIITNSVAANTINANSGTFNTANIPELTADHIKANVINAVNNGNGTINADKINVSEININNLGGVNLLRETSTFNLNNWAVNSNPEKFTCPNPGELKIGYINTNIFAKYIVDYLDYVDYNDCTVTLSFDAKYEDDGTGGTTEALVAYIGFSINSRINSYFTSSSDNYCPAVSFSLTDNWVRYSITKTIPTDLSSGKAAARVNGSKLSIQFGKQSACYPIHVRNIKLEKGNKATNWTEAPEDVENKINNIKTNGRNILRHSNTLEDINWWVRSKITSITTGQTDPDGGTNAVLITPNATSWYLVNQYHFSLLKDVGEEYTASVWLRADTQTTCNICVRYLQSDYADSTAATAATRMTVTVPTTWTRFSVTGTLTTVQASDCFWIGQKTTQPIYVYHPQVEKGNKVTDWTYASEDIDIAINDAYKTATNYISFGNNGIRIASANPATQNQRIELTNSRMDFYNSSNISTGAMQGDIFRIGQDNKSRIMVDGRSTNPLISIYDNNNKKRTQIDTDGLHIYSSDGTTETGLFGSAIARIGAESSANTTLYDDGVYSNIGTVQLVRITNAQNTAAQALITNGGAIEFMPQYSYHETGDNYLFAGIAGGNLLDKPTIDMSAIGSYGTNQNILGIAEVNLEVDPTSGPKAQISANDIILNGGNLQLPYHISAFDGDLYHQIYTAAWTADSSTTTTGTRLTELLTVPAGAYIITYTLPTASEQRPTILYSGPSSNSMTRDEQTICAGGSYNSKTWIKEFTTTTVLSVNSFSNINVTFTNKTRGGLKAIRMYALYEDTL